MIEMNKVFLAGNLTQDPESRDIGSDTTVCKLRMAVNRKYKSRDGDEHEETCFLDIDVFGGQAKPCGDYLRKGSPILVEGRLRLDEWKDRKTGEDRTRLKVVAGRVHFLGSRQDSNPPESQG